MATIRCPYCHEQIDAAAFPAHERRHKRSRPDGQQTDYVTLPESERAAGDLAGVPRVYVHGRCGAATGMPEEIIRTYLQNPFMYMADATFCTGCGKHVPFRDCEWSETGENLQTYMDDLRAAKPEMKPKGCLGAVVAAVGLAGAAAALWV